MKILTIFIFIFIFILFMFIELIMSIITFYGFSPSKFSNKCIRNRKFGELIFLENFNGHV